MTTIETLFTAWRGIAESFGTGTMTDAESEAAQDAAADLERQIAEAPADTARDWQIKIAVACHLDPAGDGPAHLAMASQALTALGLTAFLPA